MRPRFGGKSGGTNPPGDLRLLKAKYWQSAHWSKEYILYLKIKPTNEWWSEFINQNNMIEDNGQWSRPTDSPEWFKLPEGAALYMREGDVFDSRFFRDDSTGDCYIYDVQL